jgi:hypothetical protein
MKVAEGFAYVPRAQPQPPAPEVVPVGPLVPSGATPLEFLRSVYTDASVPLPLRVWAAVEAAPFAHPKLSAIFDVREQLRAEAGGKNQTLQTADYGTSL